MGGADHCDPDPTLSLAPAACPVLQRPISSECVSLSGVPRKSDVSRAAPYATGLNGYARGRPA
jgi:hypothetical protein